MGGIFYPRVENKKRKGCPRLDYYVIYSQIMRDVELLERKNNWLELQ